MICIAAKISIFLLFDNKNNKSIEEVNVFLNKFKIKNIYM